MANKTTVYKNDLNMVPMRKFKPEEMNLFFSICANLKEKGKETVKFHFEDLKYLSNYKSTSVQRFIDDLESTYDKMMSLGLKFKEDGKRHAFILFTEYTIDENNKTVDISVNQNWKHILNNLTSNFTKFELQEFTNLHSSYSKTLFRLFKQYRKNGYFTISIDEFREQLDVPKTYRMTNIDQRILNPALEELSVYFSNLKLKKIQARRGRKIERLEFTFDPEHDYFTQKDSQSPETDTELERARAKFEDMMKNKKEINRDISEQ